MEKNVKIALIATAVVLALLYFHNKATAQSQKVQISEADKLALFLTSLGYRGGAAPPQEVLEKAQIAAEAARKKIVELGLQKEYEDFLKSHESDSPPV